VSDNGNTPNQERLDEIQERIDEVRESVNEDTELDTDERRFSDDGTEGKEVVDDEIAPG
jgi:hypothetical protein